MTRFAFSTLAAALGALAMIGELGCGETCTHQIDNKSTLVPPDAPSLTGVDGGATLEDWLNRPCAESCMLYFGESTEEDFESCDGPTQTPGGRYLLQCRYGYDQCRKNRVPFPR